MTPSSYADAIDDAFDRLRGVGFEFGPNFAAHAPMAAETLVTIGCHDLVPGWIESNRRRRHYDPPPAPWTPLADDPAEWRLALGDYRRVTDWTVLFDRRLAADPWREVLVEWWPRLLDGAFGALTHGLIRTAHAVRSLTSTPRPSPLQLHELAQGLAYWAARYTPMPLRPGPQAEVADVGAALSELTAVYAGRYADRAPHPAVPLVHSITAPAAVRLVLPCLPAELAVRSYRVAERLAASVWAVLPCSPGDPPTKAPGYRPPSADDLVTSAVEFGDEHLIKLAEACRRENAVSADDRYLAAAHTLNHRYRRGEKSHE